MRKTGKVIGIAVQVMFVTGNGACSLICFKMELNLIKDNVMDKKKIKIEIKHYLTGKVLFEYEKENNTVKDTVVEAVKNGADLGRANLGGANLGGADLGGAELDRANLGGADLGGANLGGANLCGAKLGRANLGRANLCGADLGGADLGGANLGRAKLGRANLGRANLCGADLGGADLGGANLGGANLCGANLCDADLGGAYLGGANLCDAKLGRAKDIPFIPFACPSDGAFIGWKKVQTHEFEGNYLVKLLIPEDAKRCSATGTKCRCDKATVLAIYQIDDDMKEVEAVMNDNYIDTMYKVGEEVLPDSFDEDRWNECSHGIHFFINKQDAIDY